MPFPSALCSFNSILSLLSFLKIQNVTMCLLSSIGSLFVDVLSYLKYNQTGHRGSLRFHTLYITGFYATVCDMWTLLRVSVMVIESPAAGFWYIVLYYRGNWQWFCHVISAPWIPLPQDVHLHWKTAQRTKWWWISSAWAANYLNNGTWYQKKKKNQPQLKQEW